MLDIRLNSAWDLSTESVDIFGIIEGPDALVQSIKIHLQTFFGEIPLNTNLGVTWVEDILVASPNFNLISSVIKNEILKVPGVTQIIDFNLSLNRQTRVLSIDFVCDSELGLIPDVIFNLEV